MSPRRCTATAMATRKKAKAKTKVQAKVQAKSKATSKKVLRLEEMKVEGRIQKPQAMFLMPRARLDLTDIDRGESFLPQVTKAVEKDPF